MAFWVEVAIAGSLDTVFHVRDTVFGASVIDLLANSDASIASKE